jgi:hypothetical protein
MPHPPLTCRAEVTALPLASAPRADADPRELAGARCAVGAGGTITLAAAIADLAFAAEAAAASWFNAAKARASSSMLRTVASSCRSILFSFASLSLRARASSRSSPFVLGLTCLRAVDIAQKKFPLSSC